MIQKNLQKQSGSTYNEVEIMVLTLFQVIISLLLIGAILLQAQGTGLTASFGGSGEFYRSKRSVERLLFQTTIVLTVLFGVTSFILLFPHK